MKRNTYSICMMMEVWYMETCDKRLKADKRNTLNDHQLKAGRLGIGGLNRRL
jgi:hypothetical protein